MADKPDDIAQKIVEMAIKRSKVLKKFIGTIGAKQYNNYAGEPGWFYSPNSGLNPSYGSDKIPKCLRDQGIIPPDGEVVVDWTGTIQYRIKEISATVKLVEKFNPPETISKELIDIIKSNARPKQDKKLIERVENLINELECNKFEKTKIKKHILALNSKVPEELPHLHLCNVFVYDSLYVAGYKPPLNDVKHYYAPSGSKGLKGSFFEKKEVPYNEIWAGDIGLFLGSRWRIKHMGIVVERINASNFKTIDTNPNVGEHVYKNTKGNGLVFLRVKRR